MPGALEGKWHQGEMLGVSDLLRTCAWHAPDICSIADEVEDVNLTMT